MARRPGVPSIYNALLADARRRGYGINEAGRRRLVDAFEKAIRDLNASARSSDPLTRDRARALRRELRAMIVSLSDTSVKLITSTRELTIEEVVDMHRRAAVKLARAYNRPTARIAARFDELNVRAVATLASRRQNAGVFVTLMKHHRTEAVRDLDRLIDAAVAQGQSPARLTRDIARLLSGDPKVSLTDYRIARGRVSGVRTLFSDARRIAVTETNNALREANTVALQASNLIEGATWQLSGRHHIPDECDELAAYTGWNGEPGAHPVDDWPAAPHPYCACTQGGPVYYRDPSTWK